jgi:hypothetical protein
LPARWRHRRCMVLEQAAARHSHIGRLKVRTRNTAICPRVTVTSGQ